MWRRDGAHDIVRVGRLAAERWTGTRRSLSLVDRQPLKAATPEALATGIEALFAQPATAPVLLVLESHWMPCLLVDTGGRLWSAAQARALFLHRLSLVYGDAAEPVGEWALRLDFVPGERFVPGYALPTGVEEAVRRAADACGVRWRAVLPAIAWGADRLELPGAVRRKPFWWAWPEQDRCLLVRVDGGRWLGLHAGLPMAADADALLAAARAQAWRLGCDDAPLVAAQWTAASRLPARADGVHWQALAGMERMP